MELKQGYKMTDVGVIPEDWEAATIGEVATFSGGSQPPRSTFKFVPTVGYVRLIQIRDYKTNEYESYIPATMARKTCTSDDIMIGRYGPPIFQILRGIEGAYNVALIKAIPNERISSDYLFNILNQDKLFQLIDSLSRRSSGQTGVEMPALKAFGLPLPPIEEQRAIAAALSDVDALLSGLDQLIAKKRDIKQAAMQQLLTGKTRLPGFGGEWEVTDFDGIVEKFVGGGTPSRANKTYWGGDIPWVTVKDFSSFKPRESQEYITKIGLINSASNLIPKGTLITSTRMALGKAVVYEIDVAINQDLKALLFKQGIAVTFMLYWFNFFEKIINDLGGGSTVKGISIVELKRLRVFLPKENEQIAIASILSDMDTELLELEARRNKTRNIKQAMMQELLTGKTRLVGSKVQDIVEEVR